MYALAACWTGLFFNSRKKVAGCGELTITSRLSICGRCTAKVHATAPPQSWATNASSGAPPGDTCAINASRSAIKCLTRYASGSFGLDDCSKPRRFGAMQR